MESLQSLIKTRKVRIVGSVMVGFVLFLGVGFFVWTINNEKNLGTQNSEASGCIDKCVGPCVEDSQVDSESYNIIVCDLGKSCISYNTCDGKYVSVNYKSGWGGRIVGETKQNVLFREDASEIRAVPNDGYVFSYWLDELTGKQDTSEFSTEITRLDTNVDGVIRLKAIFEKK